MHQQFTAFLEKGKKYEVIKKEGKNNFKENIGNFVGIYVTDENIKIGIFDTYFNEIDFKIKKLHKKFSKVDIANILIELKKQYQFLYTAVVVDTAVKEGKEIGFAEDKYNMFNCPGLLSAQDCIFVNSTIIKMIYIRQCITNQSNLLYYDLKLRQFSIIEKKSAERKIR